MSLRTHERMTARQPFAMNVYRRSSSASGRSGRCWRHRAMLLSRRVSTTRRELGVAVLAEDGLARALVVNDYAADLVAERAERLAGQRGAQGAHDGVRQVALDLLVQVEEVAVVRVERGAVDVGLLAQLLHGDLRHRLLYEQVEERFAQQQLREPYPMVLLHDRPPFARPARRFPCRPDRLVDRLTPIAFDQCLPAPCPSAARLLAGRLSFRRHCAIFR